MPDLLRVEGLAKSFDGFRAVDDVRLTVETGGVVAVIGPNGAGKTTLFNLITGLLRPDRGAVLLNGEDISRLPAHQICRRGIGRTFQIANIFPRLTVFENVHVSVLAQRRQSRRMFRAATGLAAEETSALLSTTGLAAKGQQVAGVLSHGDQRVLEIAIALGSRPALLVLDEPTAGMSPEETAATMALIRRLAGTRELTVLFCEHDMDVVFAVAQSIMVMRHGRTIVQDRPEAVRQNREVQDAYLGDPRA